MLKGFVTALRTLTVLPVPGRDAEDMASSLPWFPVVGLLLGAASYYSAMALHAGRMAGWPLGAAALLVVGGVILTRGMHLDGLSDWADGFWGSREREKSLAIMKDPRMGAFGGIAIVCALMTKWASLARLVETGSLAWIMAAYLLSRSLMVDLAVSQPYARAEGGTAAPFVGGAKVRHLSIALAACAVLVAATCGLQWKWAAVFCASWILARLFGMWSRRRIGGVTGDILGAWSELAETSILAAGAALS